MTVKRGAVAAYVRVSSPSQNASTQRAAIRLAARARQDKLTIWYSDVLSGRTINRPGLARLRVDARAGALRRLYIYRLDRLTRSGIRDTLRLVDELRGAGVELVTIADGFDLDGHASEVVLAVMAWASQMERMAIAERISAARARVKAEGRDWGRPKRMARGELKAAQKLRREGRSIRAIATAMGIPRATLARGLSQKGTYASGGKNRVVRASRARAS